MQNTAVVTQQESQTLRRMTGISAATASPGCKRRITPRFTSHEACTAVKGSRAQERVKLSHLHEHDTWLQVLSTAPTALNPHSQRAHSVVDKDRLRCDDKTKARRLEDSRMGALDLIKVEAVDTHT